MPVSWLRIPALMITSSWLFVGCSGAKKIDVGGACILNSDCNQGLVCTWGKCHAACNTSADCQPGQSCIIASAQATVCESPTSCIYNSDCPTGLVCAVDQQCRKQCQTNVDCTSGQTCTSTQTCAELSQVDPNNNLFLPDGGVSGSGGASGAAGAGGGGGSGDARVLDSPGAQPDLPTGGTGGSGSSIDGSTGGGGASSTGGNSASGGTGNVCVQGVCQPGCGIGSNLSDAATCVEPTGLVAWWKAEGNALDSAGSNNGTPLNGVAFAQGRVGRAFSLNGTNQALSVPDGIVPHTTRQFSVSAWVYPYSATRVENAPYFDSVGARHMAYYGGANAGEYYLALGTVTNSTSDAFFCFGVDLVSGWYYACPNSRPISSGSWYHIAGIRRGTSIELWVNGELSATQTIPDTDLLIASWSPGQFPSQIGAYHNGSSGNDDFWNGLIDEVKIFNRALSASEVAETACCE